MAKLVELYLTNLYSLDTVVESHVRYLSSIAIIYM